MHKLFYNPIYLSLNQTFLSMLQPISFDKPIFGEQIQKNQLR